MGQNPMVIAITLSVVCSNVEQQTSNLKFYSFSKVYNLVFVQQGQNAGVAQR